MSCTWFRFLRLRSRSQSGQRSKSCHSNNSKTTEANLTKLYRKIEHDKKVCRAQELGSYAQGQGHNQVKGQIVLKIVLLIYYGSKYNETSQKDIAYWEGVSCTRLRFVSPRSRSQSGQRSKSCLSNNSKTTEALTKLYRKIEHNEKVCSAQEMGSSAQGQGHNQVKGQMVPKIVLLVNYWSNFDKTSQKDKT